MPTFRDVPKVGIKKLYIVIVPRNEIPKVEFHAENVARYHRPWYPPFENPRRVGQPQS